MTTLSFHHEIYSAIAIDEACSAFASIAKLERTDAMPYYTVVINDDETAGAIADEFSNYFLGLTVDERRGGGA